MPVTVLLTDDKEVVRRSIRLLLSSDPGIFIIGEVTNFSETIQLATELKPQVIVMDMHMTDDSCVNPGEFKSLLNSLGARLIAISFWDDESTRALAENFGAVKLLDKLTLSTELIPAIKATASKHPTASVN